MRYLQPWIENDLRKKMVFVGGPRQCGKTTLAKAVLSSRPGRYLNWDLASDRRRILDATWSDEERLVVLDELHKYPKWKNLVKGLFDTSRERHQFLVTGSARLDVFRRGGDSLLGRYHYWRLHPFTLDELPPRIDAAEGLRRLMEVGGFPEPFLDNDPREARRWREERYDRIIRDDIRDLENVRNVEQMGLLLHLLRERAGSLIVVSNLARDLQVSPVTIKAWIEIFEKMYLIFTVKPYTKDLPRALQKPFKVYFFDNADVVGDEGARFENLVATHLLKRCHFNQDHSGERWELRFARDKEKHEVDFVVLRDGKIQELIEAKWSDAAVSPSLIYFGQKLRAPRLTQLVGTLRTSKTTGALRVCGPLARFGERYPKT